MKQILSRYVILVSLFYCISIYLFIYIFFCVLFLLYTDWLSSAHRTNTPRFQYLPYLEVTCFPGAENLKVTIISFLPRSLQCFCPMKKQKLVR